MENKEEKKLHYLLIGYANSKTLEDSKRQWKEILEHINLELDKAREEGIEEGWKSCEEYRTLLNRALIGDVNFAEKDELKAMENRFESLRRKYS